MDVITKVEFLKMKIDICKGFRDVYGYVETTRDVAEGVRDDINEIKNLEKEDGCLKNIETMNRDELIHFIGLKRFEITGFKNMDDDVLRAAIKEYMEDIISEYESEYERLINSGYDTFESIEDQVEDILYSLG
ncbi:hypothetical protein DSCW_01070 [Desulfosarcina widdelii]|uniref:Uncharacterized protein n=1 Tax=Desulfosarcina widdelii TaxID=947919 RepID=A0A5K7YWI3_9BACT|nr:hypothetical protein [Desulfosarcina widdelii]BBO72690.1 hypothetical protein DSCW_01070 [Desulfosarcina widdelii]